MKCAEVMEWMHRYLDQDLNRDEIIEMFRHIDNCPSCAEVFEQLQFLSKQLEKLPDVKAPFSLVDSILPQLDEIDRAARDQSATRAEENVVVPFSPESTRSKSSKGTSMVSRIGIGAVAAAVLLGVAILNMPDKMPGAEVEQSLMSNTTSLSNGAADMAIESQSTDSSNDPAASGMLKEVEEETSAKKNDDNNPSADTVVPTDPSVAPEESPVASSEPNPAAGERAVPVPTDSLMPKATEEIQSPSQNPVTPLPPENSNKTDNDQSKLDMREQDVAADKNVDGDVGTMESSNEVPYIYKRGVMSLRSSSERTVRTWTSPDELYIAELVGQQLVISSNSAEERLPLTSYPLEGNWVSGEWSTDSKQFTYIIEQNGINITKVYTIQAKASLAPSPAASPVVTPEVEPTSSPTNE